MKLTEIERRTLLAIVFGAQDDDDGTDQKYSDALNSIARKVDADRVKAAS